MPSRFKIKLKLQGLELEVEGAREDVPLLTKNVGAQIAGMLMPATNMAENKAPATAAREAIDVTPRLSEPAARPARRAKPRRSPAEGNPNGKEVADIIWEHDVNKWGSPLQNWKAVDKAVWLLHVAKASGAADQMTAHQMVTSFARMFRTAGKLNRGNIGRDFANLNIEPPAKVHSDTSTPPNWYLTDAGAKVAEALVLAARGGNSAG